MPGLNGKINQFFSIKNLNKLPSLLLLEVCNKLPILNWIHRYNFLWFQGDLIAGLTLGLMIIPQSLAYAKIASLNSEHGLYSSFSGPLLYAFLGTTKDCVVGPSSIISLFLAQTISSITESFSNNSSNITIDKIQITITITFLSGLILLLLSLFRLGFVFLFVSNTTINAFAAASSIVICTSQLAKVIGIYDFNTHSSGLTQIYDLITKISHVSKYDSIIGLSSLIILFIMKYLPSILKVRRKSLNKIVVFLCFAKNIIVFFIMLLITFIIYKTIYNSNIDLIPYKILKTIKQGFPTPISIGLDLKLIKVCLIPSIVTAMLITLEHMGSAKLFSIQNKYVISENQELFSLGLINIVGSFFGALPVTGSFSKSAVNSQSGVYTPLGGLITGSMVILSLLFLTGIFRLMPEPALSAVIFVALVFKITGYPTLKKYYLKDKCDFIIYVSTCIAIVVTDIKNGLVMSIVLSIMFMLFRICKPSWQILSESNLSTENMNKDNYYIEVNNINKNTVSPLLPGIIIFKWQESLIYPNADYFKKKVMNSVYALTKKSENNNNSKSVTKWSAIKPNNDHYNINKILYLDYTLRIYDPIELKHRYIAHVYNKDKGASLTTKNNVTNNNENTNLNLSSKSEPKLLNNNRDELPELKAIIFDFSCVNYIDSTGLEKLRLIKQELMIEYTNSIPSNSYNSVDGLFNTTLFQMHFVNVNENVLKTLSFYNDLIGLKNRSSHNKPDLEKNINNNQIEDHNDTAPQYGNNLNNYHGADYVHSTIEDAVQVIINNLYG